MVCYYACPVKKCEMNVSIVVLNWNAAEDTIACLKPMLDWQAVWPLLIVVDNASHSNDVAAIQQQLPSAHLIKNSKNEGFSGGSNRGMAHALAQGDAPILLLNNDAVISETAVLQLIQTLAENPKIGLIVPQLFDENGKLLAVGGKNPAFHMQTRVEGFPNDDPLQIVETVSGTAVLIRAAMLRQIGLLDERFFFSTEMADLSLRAKKQGYLAAVDQQTRASHTVSRSSHLRDSLYTYYIIRNRFLILRNHYPWHLHLLGFWKIYSFALCLKLWLNGSRSTARAVWLGVWDGLLGHFGDQNEHVMSFCNRAS
jgi:GT2 family glycosyltransferase